MTTWRPDDVCECGHAASLHGDPEKGETRCNVLYLDKRLAGAPDVFCGCSAFRPYSALRAAHDPPRRP